MDKKGFMRIKRKYKGSRKMMRNWNMKMNRKRKWENQSIRKKYMRMNMWKNLNRWMRLIRKLKVCINNNMIVNISLSLKLNFNLNLNLNTNTNHNINRINNTNNKHKTILHNPKTSTSALVSKVSISDINQTNYTITPLSILSTLYNNNPNININNLHEVISTRESNMKAIVIIALIIV